MYWISTPTELKKGKMNSPLCLWSTLTACQIALGSTITFQMAIRLKGWIFKWTHFTTQYIVDMLKPSHVLT